MGVWISLGVMTGIGHGKRPPMAKRIKMGHRNRKRHARSRRRGPAKLRKKQREIQARIDAHDRFLASIETMDVVGKLRVALMKARENAPHGAKFQIYLGVAVARRLSVQCQSMCPWAKFPEEQTSEMTFEGCPVFATPFVQAEMIYIARAEEQESPYKGFTIKREMQMTPEMFENARRYAEMRHGQVFPNLF
jgi:hypothetical protein